MIRKALALPIFLTFAAYGLDETAKNGQDDPKRVG